jgi:amidase
VNPRLNAVVHRMYDTAVATAEDLPDGPLRGVPMVVKDFDGFVRGVPYTASCRFLEGFVPAHDAEAIARLRRAGAVFVAKTNLPELALVATTESKWRGATRNPWDTDRSVGGSSGGSAALVAARAVPAGHGGDGGGSLRIPAAHCGLVGLKATRGRIPVGPDQGEGWGGYVQWGVLVRSVRDAALFLDVMAGPMAGDPYHAPPKLRPFPEEIGADPGKLRIAFTTRSLYGRETDPACRAAVEQTAKRLADLGHDVEEAHPPVDRDRLVKAYLTQVAVGTAAEIDDFARWTGRTPTPGAFEPTSWMLGMIGRVMSGVELQHARDAVHEAGRSMAKFHQRYDLLITSTAAHPPVRIGELGLKAPEKLALRVLRRFPSERVLRRVLDTLADDNLERTPNTQLCNQTGQPAISLPLGKTPHGHPVGVQLIARFGEEATLLRVASQLEAAHPWSEALPPVHA